MEKQEIISILRSAKPHFDQLNSIYDEAEVIWNSLQQKKYERSNGLGIFDWCITIILGIFYIVPGILYYKSTKKKRDQRLDQEIASLEKEFADYQEKVRSLIPTVLDTRILEIIPEQYLNDPAEHAVDHFLTYFETGRADSMKEAINLFEEEKHRNNLERIQKESLIQNQLQLDALRTNNTINAINALANLNK